MDLATVKGTSTMAKKKDTAQTGGFVMLSTTLVKKQQDLIATTGTTLLTMVRENANQCLAHFKAHGDITLAERLLASLPAGMVVAGLAKWFKDHAPVKFDAKGKAEVTGDHNETKLEEAQAKNWVDDAAVKDRSMKPIEPITIGFLKGRIKGLQGQLKKAAEPGGRGFGSDNMTAEQKAEEAKRCEVWLNRVITVIDNVSAEIPAVANQAKQQDKPSKVQKAA